MHADVLDTQFLLSIALPTVHFNISGLKGVRGSIASALLESLRKVEASTHEGAFLPGFDVNNSGLSVIICNF